MTKCRKLTKNVDVKMSFVNANGNVDYVVALIVMKSMNSR